MKSRVMTQAYVVMVIFGLPTWFVLWRILLQLFFARVSFEDGVVQWADTTFNLPTELQVTSFWERFIAGGSRKILVDLLALPLLIWTQRFQAAALEELRLALVMTPLVAVQVGARWMGLSFMLLLLPPYGAILLHRVLRLAGIWELVALLLAASLFLFLSFWSYQFANRRLEHLQQVQGFERLKQ